MNEKLNVHKKLYKRECVCYDDTILKDSTDVAKKYQLKQISPTTEHMCVLLHIVRSNAHASK